MGENKLPPEYAYLEQLSMEQLGEIVRADANSTSSGNEEYIFAVLGVIEKRKEELPDYKPADTDNAWENFQHYFNTPDGARLSLYPVQNSVNQKQDSATHQRWIVRKAQTVIVAAIAALLAGLLTAQAIGVDILRIIAQWTDDVFHFEGHIVETEREAEWVTSLIEQGIDSGLIPTWIPDGFDAGELVIQDLQVWKEIYQPFYASEGQAFAIRIRVYSDLTYVQDSWFEKDPTKVEQLVCNERIVYIFSNYEEQIAVTMIDSAQVSVIGGLSKSSLESIFNSIPKGDYS